MAHFKFTAIKPSGERYEGVFEAENRSVLAQQFKKEGDTLIVAEEMVPKTGEQGLNSFSFLNFFGRIKMDHKIMFARNLGTMLEAGLPLTRALAVQERQTRNKKLKSVLAHLGAQIDIGRTLNQALADFPNVFPPLFVSMVRAGEESGSLSESLKIVSNQLERSNILYKKVRGALIYPAIIFSVMIIIGVLMLIFLVPTLTATFKDMKIELPMSTQLVIAMSDFLQNHFFLAFGGLVGIFCIIVLFARTPVGKRSIDFVVLHIPVISPMVKETNVARTARTLSSLLSSGVDFLVAVKITGEVVQNSYYKAIIKRAELSVEKGDPISTVFMDNERFYPSFVGEMVSIGEETGKIGQMLLNVAEFYENEVEQKTKNMSTVIEPFLMVFVGLAVGFFAISMLGPTYSLVDAI